ncbi:MAG: hypothetical protein HQL31_08740 [Planctomycetes bacterium]|nr:hypothetical protein [Planctomycetota bacterium]
MEKREIVKAAIAHRETPRTPYCISLTGEAAERLRKELKVEDADAWLDNDVECIGFPWWKWHELGAEWQGMLPPTTPPRVQGFGSYEETVERVKRISGQTGRYILATVWGSHFEKAYFARGLENFLADMGAEPEFARGLLKTIIEKNLVMLDNLLSLPEIDGVLLGSDWGTQRDLIMSPDIWEEMIRPGEQREYDLIHGHAKDVWIHSCGDITKIMSRLVDMGVDVLNPIQPECMDIAKLKADYGEKLTFWGGISTQKTLPYGSPEEVRRETAQVRDLMARGGGYILSPAQSIQGDVPAANLAALRDVAMQAS